MRDPAASIAARATIAAPPAAIFRLLGDLDRHGDLTDHGMQILVLHGPPGGRTGGLVQLRGPMGVTRLARTRLRGAQAHSRLWGTAETTEGARAVLEWRVEPRGEDTHVEVRLDVQARTFRDRALLALGGRAWLGARLRAALERLAQTVRAPEVTTGSCPGAMRA
jgi:Polyketide cyclase / dehydrase and lipid transport